MGFLQKIFGLNDKTNNINNKTMSVEEYNNYNNAKIQAFINKYDLSTKEGIISIPTSEARMYTDVNSVSVVYMPEKILSRKATEYKKEKNYDLAIECLKKVNELLPYSPFAYVRNDYERLVDVLVLAGYFKEAKDEHQKLDKKYGSRLMELKKYKRVLWQWEVRVQAVIKQELSNHILHNLMIENNIIGCLKIYLNLHLSLLADIEI